MIFKVTFFSLNLVFIQTDTHSAELSLKVLWKHTKNLGFSTISPSNGQQMTVCIKVVPQECFLRIYPIHLNLLEATK